MGLFLAEKLPKKRTLRCRSCGFENKLDKVIQEKSRRRQGPHAANYR